MKKMILGCFLYGTAIGLYAQAPQGDFKGSIQIGQTTMPIVFHFGQQNGQPTTTMDSPAPVSYTHLTLPTILRV